MAKHAGRKGRPWQRLRAQILAASDVCHICGHGGSRDVDHVIPRSLLIQLGADPADPTNLRPAHGANSRCPTCGRCCNASKGARLHVPAPRTSRQW